MDDYPARIADLVRAALADLSEVDSAPGSPSGTILVERAELPIVDLEDLHCLTITVLDGEDQGSVADRGGRHYSREIEVTVTVQQRIPDRIRTYPGKQKIRAFRDVVATVLSRMRVTQQDDDGNTYTPVRYQRTTLDREQLAEFGVAEGYITVTYLAVV